LIEKKNTTIKQKPETAILVGLITNAQQKEKVQEYLDELAFLVETAGGVTVERFTQRLDSPNSRTYVGTGKLEEIRQYVKAAEIDMVILMMNWVDHRSETLKKLWNVKSLIVLTSS